MRTEHVRQTLLFHIDACHWDLDIGFQTLNSMDIHFTMLDFDDIREHILENVTTIIKADKGIVELQD